MKENKRQDDNLPTYWDERCKIHGHTGYTDELIYSYDQPLRIRAINKALSWSKIKVDRNTKILDIGCGTGDLLLEFAKMGANITGIDMSNEVIIKTKERFFEEGINANLLAQRIEEAKFNPHTFDLLTCITVLQHIMNERSFSIALQKIVDITRERGYILILELSPPKGNFPSSNSHYIVERSREEYVNALNACGCCLINEFGVPQIGIIFLKYLRETSAMVIYVSHILSYLMERSTINNAQKKERPNSIFAKLYRSIQRTILRITYPLDYNLFPFPKYYTDYRILVFQKWAD